MNDDIKSYAITKKDSDAVMDVLLSAYVMAKTFHTGKRIGGAPEISHQEWIASCLMMDVPGIDEIRTDCAILAFLHDILEDHKVQPYVIENMFGVQMLGYCLAISKEVKATGDKKTHSEYINGLLVSPVVVITKLVDRLHNLISMVTRKPERQKSYAQETRECHIPMAHKAKELFPEYAVPIDFLLNRIEEEIKEKAI